MCIITARSQRCRSCVGSPGLDVATGFLLGSPTQRDLTSKMSRAFRLRSSSQRLRTEFSGAHPFSMWWFQSHHGMPDIVRTVYSAPATLQARSTTAPQVYRAAFLTVPFDCSLFSGSFLPRLAAVFSLSPNIYIYIFPYICPVGIRIRNNWSWGGGGAASLRMLPGSATSNAQG